jgi:uncharacterized membrane protein
MHHRAVRLLSILFGAALLAFGPAASAGAGVGVGVGVAGGAVCANAATASSDIGTATRSTLPRTAASLSALNYATDEPPGLPPGNPPRQGILARGT